MASFPGPGRPSSVQGFDPAAPGVSHPGPESSLSLRSTSGAHGRPPRGRGEGEGARKVGGGVVCMYVPTYGKEALCRNYSLKTMS